jgi:prepilin-type N-terminal cleavage/methylation domain-containing protein
MHARRRDAAFTLVELVLVVIILGIASLVVVPRIVSRDRRQEEQAVEGVRELLSAAARREALTSRGVALEFDVLAGSLSVLAPRARKEGDWSRDTQWTRDLFVPPAALGPLELTHAVVDSVPQPADYWLAVLSGLDMRPEIRLTLTGTGTGRTWVVTLPPDAGGAGIAAGAAGPAAIDLDRSGQRDAAW